MNGDETVIDVGSPSYLLPLVNLNKLYDIKDFKQITGSDPLFVVGAGAGPWPYAGVNCEVSFFFERQSHRLFLLPRIVLRYKCIGKKEDKIRLLGVTGKLYTPKYPPFPPITQYLKTTTFCLL